MNKFAKTILFIIILLFFIFLFLITFILKSENLIENLNYEKTENGIFEIKKDGNNGYLKEKINGLKDNTIILNNITTTSRFFSVNGNFTETNSGSYKIININSGIFLFEINEVDNKIIIKSNGYTIKNIGAGSFFINNINPKKILIFSLDLLMNINITKDKTNEFLTNIFLYPHSYFENFDPERNDSVKNGDSLRIAQNLNITFFNEKIYPNGEINNKILSLFSGNEENYNIYIKDIISYIKKEYINNSKEIEENLYIFPGENFIKKYFYLFFNNEKKKLYYKNILLKDIILLNKSPNLDNSLITYINEYLIELEKIDKKEADYIREIINYFYLKNNNSNNINYYKNVNFSNLILKNQNESELTNTSLLFLKNIFKNYDFNASYNFFQSILLFKNKYYEDLGLDKKDLGNKYLNETDYLLNFIENIINSNFLNEEEYISKIIILFKDYIDIKTELSNNDDEVNKATIYKINKLLNNLNAKIFGIYFKGRDEKNLLDRKKIIEKENLNNLKTSIKKLKDYIENIISGLKKDEDKNGFIKEFHTRINTIEEYIIAGEDTEAYTKKYYKEYKKLLGNNNSIITTNEIDSKEKLNNYLLKFNGITFNINNISEKDYNYCKNNKPSLDINDSSFKIECFEVNDFNIITNEIMLSFLFFPYEDNKILIKQKDYINTSGTYKLNTLQKDYKEKLKGVTSEKEQQKYNFNNFFINNFIKEKTNINDSTNIYIEKEGDNINPDNKEEKLIMSYKLTLLGSYGDFSLIKLFLPINYDEFTIDKETYLITISKSKFSTSVNEGNTNISYNAEFSSNYIAQDKHNFENISLLIYTIEKNGDENYILGENQIKINGIIKIQELEEKMNNLFYQISSVKELYNNINEILGINLYNKIEYNVENNNIELNFTYKKSDLLIIIQGGEVVKFTYNGRGLIKNPISIQETNNIFNSIK